jgi:DNA polymerase I-like protein with 3'-5' exonuclease and polymerase domains
METLLFDIETNGISNFRTLLGLQTIHCIALSTEDGEPEILQTEEALDRLAKADVIVGHNVQNFDIPVIQRLYPDWKPAGVVRDTLVMSRMLWPDIKVEDFQSPEFPKQLAGRHSLKAWGVRLGLLKGDFGETNDWEVFTPEMAEYCKQDVRVTQSLWAKIKKENPPESPTVREHDFAAAIAQQERNGFAFDVAEARKLHASLLSEKDSLHRKLQSLFPEQIIRMKTPSYYYDPVTDIRYTRKKDAPAALRKGLLHGAIKVKRIPFNPGSRDQISKGLIDKHDWIPVTFTNEGKPKVDESVLSSLSYPEAKELVRYLTITKRLGQLADGQAAWLKCEEGGRIYGRVNPCGAVSARCTHSSPNVAQVPRVGSPWGKECRSLFTVPAGYKLVGVDASGIELRCLAHYTFPFDEGRYASEILEGDIHSANQEAAGLPTRDNAKTFIYALCYGAGDGKLGDITGGGVAAGRELRRKFFSRMPALKKVLDGIKFRMTTQDYLTGIDGRKLRIRSQHSALNTLLQNAGAVIMKEATILFHKHLRTEGYGPEDVLQVAHVHDELQLQVREEIADDVGKLSVQSIRETTAALGFRCPLDGEYKVGGNWAETH